VVRRFRAYFLLAPSAGDSHAGMAIGTDDLDSWTALQFEPDRGVYQGGWRSRLASASVNRMGTVLPLGPASLIVRTGKIPLRF
jgi:hypothetical protein